MLKTKIIASSISNLTDARYFAAWGVEAIGFDLQEVSVMQVNALKDWVSGPKIIGQFSSFQEFESIKDVADNLMLDVIQLDALAPKEWSFSKPVYREVILENGMTGDFENSIIKSENPNFSIDDHLDVLKEFCVQSNCYLDLNLNVGDLRKILDTVHPAGIVLRGGAEEKVGLKSFDELDEIMEFLDDE